MKAIGTSSIVIVTLSGLIWSGWMIGSQTPQGEEALAKAYAMYTAEAEAESDLFAPNALRALVCGVGETAGRSDAKPCLAVAAAGRLFLVDAGSGAVSALQSRSVGLEHLAAVLLTGSDPVRSADLDEVLVGSSGFRSATTLPVYGPPGSYELVDGLNVALNAQGESARLESWAPAPEPGAPVIVFEADGLTVVAFTTKEDAHNGRVGYRFDYRGRSLVVAGDGRAEWAEAAGNAEVVLHGARSETLAQLHEQQDARPTPFEVASAARDSGAGMLVLTGVDPNPMIAAQHVREAKQAGMGGVVAGSLGMLLEMPLTSQAVNVRPL